MSIVMFLGVVGGVIVVALGLAVWYDHRAKQRGWRVGASTEEALQHRVDIEAMHNPMVQGGDQSQLTWRRRDKE